MQVKILQSKENNGWNKFLLENKSSFLQSFEWGEFQKILGKKVWRIGVGDGNVCNAQIVKETFPFLGKSFLYIPFGPFFAGNLLANEREQALERIIEQIKKIAKKENSIFLLIEPEENIQKIGEYKIEKPIKRIQPDETLILDLTQETSQILESFSSTTRYNIRLAEKKRVKVFEVDSTKENIAIFCGLMSKTSERNKFISYPRIYFEKFFDSFNGLNKKLFFAQFQEQIIAANILIYFGDTATHLHGASDYSFRQVKAPQLLQWHQIQQAKKAGFSKYDFWGISTKKWPSLTEYKKGFSGKGKTYPVGQALIFQKFWYITYKFLKKSSS